MIVLKELIGQTPLNQIPESHQNNLNILLQKINVIRKEWAKPMNVTSGYRSEADHLRIYKELNAKRKAAAEKEGKPFVETKIPMGSMHLKGAAMDISDPDGKLFDWCKANIKLLEDTGLWLEEADDQKRVHFQIFSPKSGKRFFYP